MAIGNVGDVDLMLLGNQGFKVEEDVPDRMSPGMLYDASDSTYYELDPFSFAQTNEYEEY
jgi:hypothetical protein